jgi:hypothetical protein
VQSVESQPTFRRNISPPSSGSKNKPSMKMGDKQSSNFTLVSCLAYSSTLKMEAVCSFETSVSFQQSFWLIFPLSSHSLDRSPCRAITARGLSTGAVTSHAYRMPVTSNGVYVLRMQCFLFPGGPVPRDLPLTRLGKPAMHVLLIGQRMATSH